MPGTEPATDRGGWLALAGLVLGVLLLRVAYLAWLCPFGLVEDEAQYWDWSRHLALSYYTKGPGVAWTIALFTQVLGDSELAVRVMSPIASALAMWCVGLLAADCAGGDRRVGLMAAAAYAVVPVFGVTALLGTIDGPYCAAWAVAALAGWRAMARGGRIAWLVLGAAIGVGFLYKYTMLLVVPGLALFAWTAARAGRLNLARGWRVWLGLGVVMLVLTSAPVLIWNHQQGWPTVRHLLGHVGFAEPGGADPAFAPPPAAPRPFLERWSPAWLPVFVGTQLGMVGPLLALGLWAGYCAWRGLGGAEPGANGRWYLTALAAPILLFYAAVALVAEPEGNWPMAGFVTLVPLAAWAGVDAARALVAGGRRSVAHGLWRAGLIYGLVAMVGLLLLGPASQLPVVGSWVPLGRLEQGPRLAAGVEAWRAALAEQTGREPMVIAMHYGAASHLAFYLSGQPATFCTQSRFGGRPTNHDYWPVTNLDRADLLGRDAILIGGIPEQWAKIFTRVEDLGIVPGLERRGVRGFRGLEYRGFGRSPAP